MNLIYHGDFVLRVEWLGVIGVKISMLPVPSIILYLVHFVIEMCRLEILGIDQMTPIESICYVHVHVLATHVGAKGHIGVEEVVDVRRFRFGVVDHIATYQIDVGHERHIP